MAVTRGELTTPEDGLDLKNRHAKAVVRDDAAAELEALRARIDAARTLQDDPKLRHCQDCFQRGRNAAIKAIEGA